MTRGDATEIDRACADLATEYARLGRAIRPSAARGDADEENRLRNRAQVVLCRMHALRCKGPRTQ